MNIWQFQKIVTQRLQQWAGASIFLGMIMQWPANKTARGIGVQFVGWGLINAAIAFFGQRATQKRQQQANAHTLITLTRETKNLRRLLWVNSGLDLFYMAGGWWLARRRGRDSLHWRGQGIGIMLQGGFLFLFDYAHARVLNDPTPISINNSSKK